MHPLDVHFIPGLQVGQRDEAPARAHPGSHCIPSTHTFQASHTHGKAAPSPNPCTSKPCKLPKSCKTSSPVAKATSSCWFLGAARGAEQEEHPATSLVSHRSSIGFSRKAHGLKQEEQAHSTSQDPNSGQDCDHPTPTNLQHISYAEETQTWLRGVRFRQRGSNRAAESP